MHACRFVHVTSVSLLLWIPHASAAADDASREGSATDEDEGYVLIDEPRPPVLPTLYVSFSVLQVYDTYTTLEGARHQIPDGNPIVRALVQNPAAFVAVKIATTAGSIYAAERLWRGGRRGSAILLVVLSNAAMAYVAYRNTSTLMNTR